LTVSAFRELSDNFAILADVNWQNWNQFGLVGISVNSNHPTSLTQDLHYQDTWGLAAGGQWKFDSRWMLSAGFAFDSSMVSDPDRTVSAPVGDQYRYGTGVQYKLNDRTQLGFAYELMWQGNMPLQQGNGAGTVAGTFTNTFVNFFSLNFTHKF
jgi:long-chain fatty acid transport protein